MTPGSCAARRACSPDLSSHQQKYLHPLDELEEAGRIKTTIEVRRETGVTVVLKMEMDREKDGRRKMPKSRRQGGYVDDLLVQGGTSRTTPLLFLGSAIGVAANTSIFAS